MARATPLPSGTVTFLFTDIEGSTQLWEQQPHAMRAALARHDALAVTGIEQHCGMLVKSRGEGDSLFAVFDRASDAISAVCALQQALHAEPWPPETPLRVRAALHTGEADQRGGDYYGPAVNRCARLRAIGHGGQVLLSMATAELVRRALPRGASLLDVGFHRLQDLSHPEHVFQLVHPDLPAHFPPLKSLDALSHNLPVQPTPFIGREEEVAAVRELLLREEVRLVTLTGPSGSGKTRLGLQVAADLLEHFEAGVFCVGLALISDPDLVAPTVAQALEVRETAGRPLSESLKEDLREKQLLLLLDNFEQVLGAAPLVAELLAAAPQLKVLVTSRAHLHLRGECEFPVPSLGLPDRKHLPPVELLTQYAAVALFVQRARSVKPDFALTQENASAVAAICHRLDGLPLAIELAAPRVKLFPPQALVSRLESRLKLLTGGARDLPVRQQTLRSAVAWSYDLINESEQRLFRRLAVFVGGCTLDAAAPVCNVDSDLKFEVLDGVASLVDQSLLRQEERGDGEPRFAMLETIREYALERLEESGEAEAIRRRHAQFFLALAERAEPQLRGSDQVVWLDRLEAEHDNLRIVMEWSAESGAVDVGLRLAGALRWFWQWRGHFAEVRQRLARLLALQAEGRRQSGDGSKDDRGMPGGTDTSPRTAHAVETIRAKALGVAAGLAWEQKDWRTASAFREESLAIYRQLGDKRGIASSLLSLGEGALCQGDVAIALSLMEESLAISQELDDRWGIGEAIGGLGWVADAQGDYTLARELYADTLRIHRELGDKQGIIWSLNSLGQVAQRQADVEAARAFHEESLAISREIGQKGGWAQVNLGHVARALGELGTARAYYEEALAISEAREDRRHDTWLRFCLGRVALDQGDLDEARAVLEQNLAAFREYDDQVGVAHSHLNLGHVARIRGDVASAHAEYEQALVLFREWGERWTIALTLEAFAALAVTQGQREPVIARGARAGQAARLFAAAQALREALGAPLTPAEQADYERYVATVRVALGEEAFAATWAEGLAMTLEQAVAYALEPESASRGEAE